jgi:hypothetical protein
VQCVSCSVLCLRISAGGICQVALAKKATGCICHAEAWLKGARLQRQCCQPRRAAYGRFDGSGGWCRNGFTNCRLVNYQAFAAGKDKLRDALSMKRCRYKRKSVCFVAKFGYWFDGRMVLWALLLFLCFMATVQPYACRNIKSRSHV